MLLKNLLSLRTKTHKKTELRVKGKPKGKRKSLSLMSKRLTLLILTSHMRYSPNYLQCLCLWDLDLWDERTKSLVWLLADGKIDSIVDWPKQKTEKKLLTPSEHRLKGLIRIIISSYDSCIVPVWSLCLHLIFYIHRGGPLKFNLDILPIILVLYLYRHQLCT